MGDNQKFLALYTHELFELTLKDLQDLAEEFGVKFADANNPTLDELSKVYKKAFAEMSDSWEVTANGTCRAGEIEHVNSLQAKITDLEAQLSASRQTNQNLRRQLDDFRKYQSRQLCDQHDYLDYEDDRR